VRSTLISDGPRRGGLNGTGMARYGRDSSRWAPRAAVAVQALLLCYGSSRLGQGILRTRDNEAYCEAARSVSRAVPRGWTGNRGALHLDQHPAAPVGPVPHDPSVPHPALPRQLEDVVREQRNRTIVIDDEASRYMTPQCRPFLCDGCVRVASFGTIEAYRVATDAAGRRASPSGAPCTHRCKGSTRRQRGPQPTGLVRWASIMHLRCPAMQRFSRPVFRNHR
jgi:hypothetical protein